ncbi:unnamed protein product [Durusdinium trenchii]|uniref:Decapping nuclease n=1 Tax=Durusdinium trenchii TaxID=1381693 RepID=A0ABP0JN02_9DINO
MLRTALPATTAVFPRGFRWPHWRPLVLSAAQFLHILKKPDLTSQAYIGNAGHELSLLSGTRRGKVLEQFCKKELARLNPNSKIEEPAEGTRFDGTRRSLYHSEYDFTMDGRKVECKSSQLSWNNHAKCWGFQFSSIKLPWLGFRDQAPFDDLYLTLFSPDSLHIIKHDLQTGVSKVGELTGRSGHKIFVSGARGQEGWQSARSQILGKLLAAGHCELVAHIDLSGTEVRAFLAEQLEGMAARQDHEYKGVPLNHTGPELRGFRIEKIAFEVDRILHPHVSFEFSRSSSEVDWVRGDVKVENKHGQMLFDPGRGCWYCNFFSIKCAGANVRAHNLFDELWLAIYSPFGLHFLKHPGDFDPSVMQGPRGKHLRLSAPRHVLDVKVALDHMLKKMEVDWGCQPLATVLWDTSG